MPRSRTLLVRSVVTLLVSALVPLALAGTASAGVARADVAGGAAARTAAPDDEYGFHQLVNQARAQSGLGALTRDTAADTVARAWSGRMAQSGSLAHNPNLAAEVDRTVTTQWTRLGENVGVGWDVRGLHDAFMNSPGHRANVLGDFNRVGIGVVRNPDGRLWVTFVFIKGPAIAAPTTVPPSTFQPFSGAAAFVRQQYVDILGRPADSAGLAHWQRLLESGAVSPGDLAVTFLSSAEFHATMAPVTRLYFAALHRVPDVGGAEYWADQVRSGVSLVDVARSFAASTEFSSATGAARARDFVALVYRNVLGREADPSGLDYWSRMLESGHLDRGELLFQFSESAEFVYAVRFGVTTSAAYLTLLQRSADASGFAFNVDLFWRGTAPSVIVGSFYKNAEYLARF